ncbi:MAG: cytochrome c [Chloroflexi bacterium]|nr:cytochrome c [Chloroflexota bacterium]
MLGLLGLALLLALACGGAAAPTVPPKVTDTTSPPTVTEPPPAVDGPPAQVAACVVCHTPDGRPGVGPTWQGIYGSEETLTDGTTVTVDDAYIRESILEPNTKIVEGFQPNLMPPTFRDTLSDSDIAVIIDYIKSLK